MRKEIILPKDEYAQISAWENEGGPPIDSIYNLLDQDQTQTRKLQDEKHEETEEHLKLLEFDSSVVSAGWRIHTKIIIRKEVA